MNKNHSQELRFYKALSGAVKHKVVQRNAYSCHAICRNKKEKESNGGSVIK